MVKISLLILVLLTAGCTPKILSTCECDHNGYADVKTESILFLVECAKICENGRE